MFENFSDTQPDVKHWVLVEKFSGQERILPEFFLREKFDDSRWALITSGRDRYFDAYEYNYEFDDKVIRL